MRLMRAEDDGFCRWDASQQLALRVLDDVMAAYRNGQDLTQITIDARLVDAYRALLNDSALDPALVALMLTLPSRSEEHTSELQSRGHLVCRLLLEKKNEDSHTHSS